MVALAVNEAVTVLVVAGSMVLVAVSVISVVAAAATMVRRVRMEEARVAAMQLKDTYARLNVRLQQCLLLCSQRRWWPWRERSVVCVGRITNFLAR